MMELMSINSYNKGDVVNGGIQVGFGDATDPIESASNSLRPNYDSSRGIVLMLKQVPIVVTSYQVTLTHSEGTFG